MVFCTLSLVVRYCRGLRNSLEKEVFIFFYFLGTLDVGIEKRQFRKSAVNIA